MKNMKKNMQMLKRATNGDRKQNNISKRTTNDKVIELNLNRITPFEDMDIELVDPENQRMLSS